MEETFRTLATPVLVAEITTLAGHLNAGNARFLALVAELDRRKGWAEWGVKSCAHWLNWKCGISLGAAREKVRVARALIGLPKVAAAMAEGRLSYFKVREMTRVADPGNEDYLLNIALCGTASHVEDVVCGYRRALDAAKLTREALQQRDQHLWFHTEADGSLTIRGRVPAEVGALFKRALEAALDSLPIRKTFRPERFLMRTSCTGPASGGSKRSPSWPRAFWRPVPGTSPAPTASRSWSMWMPRRSGIPGPGAASSNTDRPSRRRPPAGSPRTAAWSASLSLRQASRSMWAVRPAPSRRRSAGR